MTIFFDVTEKKSAYLLLVPSPPLLHVRPVILTPCRPVITKILPRREKRIEEDDESPR